MSRTPTTTYVPYGAFELKATYQRNMMLGILSALVLAGMLVMVGHIMIELSAAHSTTDILPPIPIVSRPSQVPTIILERPSGPKPPARPTVHGAVPVMVPDSQLFEADMAVPSQRELRAGPGEGSGSGEGTSEGLVSSAEQNGGGTEEKFPSDTQTTIVQKLPEIVHTQMPIYPELARRLGFSGSAVVRALIDREGRVRDARIVRSSGYETLDQAALEAAVKCVYAPAIQNGYPVAIWISYRVQFRLED